MRESSVPGKAINIQRVLESKNPQLARVIPKLIVRYLRRIVHEKELNAGLERLHDTKDLDFIAGALRELAVDTRIRNRDMLPDDGRIIVVSNHPLGGLDGIALIDLIGQYYGNVLIPVNDLLMNLPNIESLFVPINKHGSNREYLPLIEEAFAGESPLLHFPAGLCSRKRGGKIRDLSWQKSFIVRARRYKRDILPVHFAGRNSAFFYGLANLRRWLGIKANIEMVYLVDEMFKQQGKSFTVTIGNRISWKTFDNRLSDWSWAQQLKNHVYRIGSKPDVAFPWGSSMESAG